MNDQPSAVRLVPFDRDGANENAIVGLATGGFGFIVDAGPPVGVAIITAAHCLPELPPALSFSRDEERSYRDLVHDREPTPDGPRVWATCAFVDPIADVAILAAPDAQWSFTKCAAFESFVESRVPFQLGEVPDDMHVAVYVLSLHGRWVSCTVSTVFGGFSLSDVAGGIQSGMSGSPIVAETGVAIGMVTCSADDGGDEMEQHGQARLSHHLPGWMFRPWRVP